MQRIRSSLVALGLSTILSILTAAAALANGHPPFPR
jgi:hypothetical protein